MSAGEWWRRDWLTDLGLIAVGGAAAVLTFVTWRELAIACGVAPALAWLVPLTVDAAGVVAARVWLSGTAPADAVRFARAVTWVAIAASIGGNAVGHAVDVGALALSGWVVVAVTAIPPATLGAVVHLGHLVRRAGGGATSGATTEPEPEAEPELVAELHLAPEVATAPADRQLEDRARQLVASGAGRPRLRAELGVTDHQAKTLLARYRQDVTA